MIALDLSPQTLQSFATPKHDELLTDFIKTLPNRNKLGNDLVIQQALRDEWY